MNQIENSGAYAGDPAAEILSIRNEIAAMGANDREASDIAQILSDLNEGKITGKEAIESAQKIKANKLDYH